MADLLLWTNQVLNEKSSIEIERRKRWTFLFFFIYLEFLSFSSKLKEKRKQMFVHPMTLSTQSSEADAQMLLVIWKCNFQINLRLASRWDPLATCKHITEPGLSANICLIVNLFVEIKFVMQCDGVTRNWSEYIRIPMKITPLN